MTLDHVRMGEVLEADRYPIEIDPLATYRPVGVRGFGRGIFDYPPTLGRDLGSLRFFDLAPCRLIVSNIKGWEGAVAVTGYQESGRISSNRFLAYAQRKGRTHLGYVKNWLLSEPGLDSLGRASPGSVDRNRTLSAERFEGILMPLPIIEEQRRIAAHLDSLARQIARVSEAVPLKPLTWMLPRLLEGLLATQDLPDVRVADLVDPVNDTIHPGNARRGADTFVGLEHIESHTGRLTGSRPVGDETGRKFRFQEGDVTYGYLRPYLNKAWTADRSGLCSVEQFVLRAREGVDPRLLEVVLRSSSILDAAVEATNNLQLPRLGLGTLLGFSAPDIRYASPTVADRAEALTNHFVRATELARRRSELLRGVLPAARNEIFNAMR